MVRVTLPQVPERLNKWKLLKMADAGELKEDNEILEVSGDSQELIFVFGVLLQPTLRETAHLACRVSFVSFRIV